MEIKKIKKLLLGLVIVTFAAGCGSDDDDDGDGGGDNVDKSKNFINGQIRVGLKDKVTAIAPILDGLLADADGNITLKLSTAAEAGQYYLVDHSAKQAVAQNISGDKLKITFSISAIDGATDKITFYAFTELDVDENKNVTGIENSSKVGVKLELKGASESNVLDSTVTVGSATALTGKHKIAAADDALKNAVIVVEKGNASTAAELSLFHGIAGTVESVEKEVDRELTDAEIGSPEDGGNAALQVLSTELKLATTDKVNTSKNLVGATFSNDTCVNTGGAAIDATLEAGAAKYQQFGTVAAKAGTADACKTAAKWQDVLTAGVGASDDKNVNVGFSVEVGTVVEAIKVEEVKAAATN